jgi:hypothetical protein
MGNFGPAKHLLCFQFAFTNYPYKIFLGLRSLWRGFKSYNKHANTSVKLTYTALEPNFSGKIIKKLLVASDNTEKIDITYVLCRVFFFYICIFLKLN